MADPLNTIAAQVIHRAWMHSFLFPVFAIVAGTMIGAGFEKAAVTVIRFYARSRR